jgi:putative transposase
MRDYLCKLEPECIYHIYNHANGSEPIFFEPRHYHFFLKQYSLYAAPVVDTFCYCLMRNHFHFLVRVKPEKELLPFFEGLDRLRKKRSTTSLTNRLSKQFSNLFNSYTVAVNKDIARMGSIFMKNYRRLKVEDEKYLLHLVRYIHHNPLEARLTKDLSKYPYSSYRQITSRENKIVQADQVIGWFGDMRAFKDFHREPPEDPLF